MKRMNIVPSSDVLVLASLYQLRSSIVGFHVLCLLFFALVASFALTSFSAALVAVCLEGLYPSTCAHFSMISFVVVCPSSRSMSAVMKASASLLLSVW